MTDPISTPAQMREAAARLIENLQTFLSHYADKDAWDGYPAMLRTMIADAETLRRALPVAEPAPVAVRIKPLVWSGGYRPIASPEPYQIWPDNGGSGAPDDPIENFGGFMLYSPHMMALGVHPTIEAAQAAANAASILSQIDAVSVAQVRAEALDALLADDEMCLRLAEGYDREDAAQRGEPSPHTMGDEGYAEWAADRIACAKEGLRAIRALMEKPE